MRTMFFGVLTTLLLITMLGTTLLLVHPAIGRAHEPEDDNDPETTEVVVKLNPASGATIDTINAAYGTTTLQVMVNSAAIYRLGVPTGSEADDIADAMENDARLLYAEPNFRSEAPEGNPRHIGAWGGPDDSAAAPPYAPDLLGLADAHALRRGAGVVVAVLDTGVQLDHPDLADRWTEARYDFVDDDPDPSDMADGVDDDGDGLVDEIFGHGTHVAGIVAQTAPEAQIMPLRVLNADGHGNIFVIAEAVQFALNNGAQVINLSLGAGEESDLLEDILEDAVSQYDVVIAAAAGNQGGDVEQYPAAEDGVMAVTATNAQDQKPDFASYGGWINVAAPGVEILSALPGSGQGVWSGTSMAVPFAAGQAALVRSALPDWRAEEVMAHIEDLAQSIEAQNPGFEGELGAGRIDVGGSLRALCADDGTCQAPASSGDIELKTRALVESRPDGGLIGTWVIGGYALIANSDTEFEEDDGLLLVGTCAEAEYLNTSPYTALEISREDPGECSASTTPLPTFTPTVTPSLPPPGTPATPTPVASVTPSPSASPTLMATTTVAPTPTATRAPDGSAQRLYLPLAVQ